MKKYEKLSLTAGIILILLWTCTVVWVWIKCSEPVETKPEPTYQVLEPEPVSEPPKDEMQVNTIEEPEAEPKEPTATLIGTFTLVHYCNCVKCTGTSSNQPTASGRYPESGVTVAVDPKVIPLGTRLRIAVPCGDRNYAMYRANARADDTGGSIKGNKIDVYVDSHEEALKLGVIHNALVYVIGG